MIYVSSGGVVTSATIAPGFGAIQIKPGGFVDTISTDNPNSGNVAAVTISSGATAVNLSGSEKATLSINIYPGGSAINISGLAAFQPQGNGGAYFVSGLQVPLYTMGSHGLTWPNMMLTVADNTYIQWNVSAQSNEWWSITSG